MTERVLSAALDPGGEEELERSLRPATLDDFVGQERVKEQLAIALDAARARGDALDHLLLAGPQAASTIHESPTSPRRSTRMAHRNRIARAAQNKRAAPLFTAQEPTIKT